MSHEMTALAVPLVEVDKHVSAWRQEHDPSGRAGVPAHISVLVPFVSPARLDDEVRRALRELFASLPAFDVTFRRTARFPNALWLAPEPAEPFVALTQAMVAQWPEHPPYEGAYPDVIPHLTVAFELSDDAFDKINLELRERLPLHDRAKEVLLLRGSNDAEWTQIESFPLGAQPA